MQHRPVSLPRRSESSYLEQSRQPLHALALVLPLVVAYEVGSRLYLTEAAPVQTIRAHSLLVGLFQDLGFAGRSLPSIAIVLSLLCWHWVSHHRWRLRPLVPLCMAGESLSLTMPLVVFFALVEMALGVGARPAMQLDAADPLAGLSWEAGAVVAIGAGLYEEFLFRLVGVSVLCLILIDVGRVGRRAGTAAAVALAAVAFTAYHDVTNAHGEVDVLRTASFLVAGVYFGAVFALRGFGIAVGVHVIYDVCALVLAGRTPT